MIQIPVGSTFLTIIEIIGTSAFAISGIRLASAKRYDWFGAYVVGLVTAIGGGTIRDLMLGVTPFWMLNSIYLTVTAVSLAIVILAGRRIMFLYNNFYIYDSIGLAFFVIVGIQKTLDMGFPFWVAITMGTITGIVGGIMRDVLLGEQPLVFRKDFYALACIIGGTFYWIAYMLGLDGPVTQSITAVSIFLVRFFAVKYNWHLPLLYKGEN